VYLNIAGLKAGVGFRVHNKHQQLIEIQRSLKGQGIEINKGNINKLYCQFLTLLGGTMII